MSADNTRSRTGTVIAVVGAGALLLWLLWRGRGFGLGRGRGAGLGGGSGTSASGSGSDSVPTQPFRPSIQVDIRAGERVYVNDQLMDLESVVARARDASAVFVHTDGDAREGWVLTVLEALGRIPHLKAYLDDTLTGVADYLLLVTGQGHRGDGVKVIVNEPAKAGQ